MGRLVGWSGVFVCVCVYMEARLPQSIDDQPTDPPHPKRRHCCRKRVDAVLEQSKNPATRFFGLQILEDTIKTRCVLLCICVCVRGLASRP